MTIETLKSPNPRNRNSISVVKSKFLSVSAMNTLLPFWKSLTRDVTSYWQADCTTDFLGDTFPPPPNLAQGLFARSSLYLKLYLQFVGQLHLIVTDYGLLISMKNTMTFTTWGVSFFFQLMGTKTKPEPHPRPSKTPLILRFKGIYSYLKLHGKETSRKRDWRSHLGIDLGTSLIAGHAITNCTNFCSSKASENVKYSAVESLPDRVGTVVLKIEWCSLTWSIMSHTARTGLP